jgi:hypothetical protein
MTRDHEEQLAEQVAMFEQADALLDRILDSLPAPDQDQDEELGLLLAGPFGVDWRTGQRPHEAPPPSWEPIVLELGEAVAVAFHLDPLWADDPADLA